MRAPRTFSVSITMGSILLVGGVSKISETHGKIQLIGQFAERSEGNIEKSDKLLLTVATATFHNV